MKPYRGAPLCTLRVTRAVSCATALIAVCAVPLMSQTVSLVASSPNAGVMSALSLPASTLNAGSQQLSSGTPYQPITFSEFGSRVLGPGALFRDALISSIGQTVGSPRQWPRTWEGYGDRLAARVGSEAISQTVVFGVSAALGQRPTGFTPCDCRGFGPRFLHAALIPFHMTSAQGTHFSLFAPASQIGSAMLATSLQPGGFSAQNGLRGGALGIGLLSATNILREFLTFARHF